MSEAGTSHATPVLTRNGPLDALRFLAALFIVLYHVAERAPVSLFSLNPAFGRGYLATDFFLMLSGYVLARTYGPRVAARDVDTLDFLKRRVLRIWPSHLAMLLLFVAFFLATSAVGIAPQNPQWFRWDQLPPQIFLAQAWFVPGKSGWNTPTWTLSALVVAYALFPLAWRRMARSTSPLLMLTVSVLAYLLLDLVTDLFLGAPSYRLPLRYGLIRGVPLFMMGLLIARLPVGGFARRHANDLAAFALVTVLGLQAFGKFDHLSLALLGLLIFAAGASPTSNWRWAGTAGRLSFSLFLTNTLTAIVWLGVLRVVEQKVGLPSAVQWMLWIATIPAAIVVAWLFERLVDTPLQQWIKALQADKPVAINAAPVSV